MAIWFEFSGGGAVGCIIQIKLPLRFAPLFDPFAHQLTPWTASRTPTAVKSQPAQLSLPADERHTTNAGTDHSVQKYTERCGGTIALLPSVRWKCLSIFGKTYNFTGGVWKYRNIYLIIDKS